MRESKVFSLPIARKRRNNATPGHRGVAGRGRDVMGGRGDSVYYSFLTSLPSFQESSSWHTPASSNYKAHTVRVGQQQDAPRRRDESIMVSYYAVENCMAPSLIAACLPLKINGQMNKLESHLGCRGALTATVEGRFSFCFLVFCCCCCRASPSLSLRPSGDGGEEGGRDWLWMQFVCHSITLYAKNTAWPREDKLNRKEVIWQTLFNSKDLCWGPDKNSCFDVPWSAVIG